MRDLNLVFGCIDLIESTAGDWYFIEINEMGQFLWKEVANPEIEILDAFTRFVLGMMGAKVDYGEKIRFSDLSASAEFNDRLAIDRATHERRSSAITLYDLL